MKSKTMKVAIKLGYLLIACWLATSPARAAVVNLTFSEDVDGFTSTWRIDDNGGSDFSGTDSVTGTYWQAGLEVSSMNVLQDSIAHVLGIHGESFISSSLDYGPLSAGYFEETSFVVHDNGHRDDFTLTSSFVGGGYDITLAAAHSVPIPAAVWLFGSGLGLLGWIRRKNA